MAFISNTYLNCSDYIFDPASGSASTDANTVPTITSSPWASATVAATAVIVSIAFGFIIKVPATKAAVVINIIHDMLHLVVVCGRSTSLFSGHHCSGMLSRQRTYLPFSAKKLGTKRFNFSCVSFFCMYNYGTTCYFWPQFQASIVLMKVPASILSEGVQVGLKQRFIKHYITTQTLNKHFETITSASAIF